MIADGFVTQAQILGGLARLLIRLLLRVGLKQMVRPFDDVEADGAEGRQGAPFLSGIGKKSCRRKEGHEVVGRQREGGSAAGPVFELLQFKSKGERTVPRRLVEIFRFGIEGASREIEVIHKNSKI